MADTPRNQDGQPGAPGNDDQSDPTQRDRLAQVQQSDLTESNVNEDFVQWLKTKGPNYLLIGVAILAAIVFYNNWKMGQARKADESWAAYASAAQPESLEDVAQEHENAGMIPVLARRKAGEQLLNAVRADIKLEAFSKQISELTETDRLNDEEREEYLSQAKIFFDRVLAADEPKAEGKPGVGPMTMHAYAAQCGLAAIAEARGEADAAAAAYKAAADRVRDEYPELAARADGRAETAAEMSAPVALPDAAAAQARNASLQLPKPISILPALEELVLPEDPEAEDASGDATGG